MWTQTSSGRILGPSGQPPWGLFTASRTESASATQHFQQQGRKANRQQSKWPRTAHVQSLRVSVSLSLTLSCLPVSNPSCQGQAPSQVQSPKLPVCGAGLQASTSIRRWPSFRHPPGVLRIRCRAAEQRAASTEDRRAPSSQAAIRGQRPSSNRVASLLW
jgi:hypothetical protein